MDGQKIIFDFVCVCKNVGVCLCKSTGCHKWQKNTFHYLIIENRFGAIKPIDLLYEKLVLNFRIRCKKNNIILFYSSEGKEKIPKELLILFYLLNVDYNYNIIRSTCTLYMVEEPISLSLAFRPWSNIGTDKSAA